jgi:ABC-2 type transport system permease protein
MNHNLYLVAFNTIVIKEVSRFTRIWIQTILPPAISMTLYFLIFGNLIGPRIGSMSGFSYVEYIAPGLIMMSIINNSYANVVSSFFGAKFQRHIEEMLVAPIPEVAMFFTRLSIHHLGVIIAVVLLTSILFSLGGFINAIFAKKFDDISIIPTFILTPLIYLGGVFYSIDLLPDFWHTVSLFNPILYMVNAFRYGLLGVSDINLGAAFAIIILFNIVLFVFSLYLMKIGKGIRN